MVQSGTLTQIKKNNKVVEKPFVEITRYEVYGMLNVQI